MPLLLNRALQTPKAAMGSGRHAFSLRGNDCNVDIDDLPTEDFKAASGRMEPFFTSPVRGLLRGCSRSGLKRSHNVSGLYQPKTAIGLLSKGYHAILRA